MQLQHETVKVQWSDILNDSRQAARRLLVSNTNWRTDVLECSRHSTTGSAGRIRRSDAVTDLRADLEQRRKALDGLAADAEAFGFFDTRPTKPQRFEACSFLIPACRTRSVAPTKRGKYFRICDFTLTAASRDILQRPIVSDPRRGRPQHRCRSVRSHCFATDSTLRRCRPSTDGHGMTVLSRFHDDALIKCDGPPRRRSGAVPQGGRHSFQRQEASTRSQQVGGQAPINVAGVVLLTNWRPSSGRLAPSACWKSSQPWPLE